MQWLICCSLVISVVVILLGLRKSRRVQISKVKQYCTECGWTKEQVQPCLFEQQYVKLVLPLCFDCCVKNEGVPYREGIC